MNTFNRTILPSVRQRISLIKGMAIISVICAHCNSVPENSGFFSKASSCLLNNFGTVGVICFFIISGFLFHCENKKSFLKKRVISLGLPWIFGSLIVYLYVALRKPPITLAGLLDHAVGNGSYFYYLTILSLMYITFAFLPFLSRITSLVALIAIGTISGLFFSDGAPIAPTPYLNYFNWVGYFSFGVLLRTYFLVFEKFFAKIYKLRFFVYVAYLAVLMFQISSNTDGWYFGFPRMFFSWCGVVAVALFAEDIRRVKFNWIRRVLQISGDSSLFVYIWHMPIAGIVANLFSRSYLIMLVLLRPLIVLGIVLLAQRLLRQIFKYPALKKLSTVIGLR